MTVTTELAQRMRTAATMATRGDWHYARSGFNSIVQASAALSNGGRSNVVLCKLFRSEWRGELNTAQDAAFIALANPVNVLVLLDALAAKDKQIAEHVARIAELEEIATDYGMKFQRAQDALKHAALMHRDEARPEQQPVGEFYHEKQWGWYQISEGDKVPDNRRVPLYSAPMAPVAMKAHHVRELVNQLKEVAITYHGTQQLRERIANVVRSALAPAASVVPDGLLSSMEEVLRISDRDHEAWHRSKAPLDILKRAAPNMLADESLKDPGGALCGTRKPDAWIPCSERMPEGMTDVSITDGINVGQGWWDGDTWQWQDNYYGVIGKVTHWQPLPAPPREE